MRKTRSLLMSLLLVLVPATVSWGDYLEVRRPVTMKARPQKDATTVANLQSGTYIIILQAEQRDGYYRAEIPAAGKSGWVYRTFVRRYPGNIPARRSGGFETGGSFETGGGFDADTGLV